MARGLSAGSPCLQDGAAGQHHRVERIGAVAGGLPAPLDVMQGGERTLDIAGRVDPAGAEPGRQRPRSRTGGGEVERDRIARVDQAEIGVEQADQAVLAFDLGFDGLFAQQCRDDPGIFFQLRQPDRAEPHRPPPGKAGADAEIDPSGRQLVERGKRVGRHRGDAVGRDQDPGAEPDMAGLDRRHGHRDKRVGAQHLGVVEPGAAEPQLLGAPHQPP